MIDQIRPLIVKFTSFAKDNLNFKRPPKLFLKRDSENSNCALGKTAYYDPQQSSVTVFITGRHPKDIIRSLAHELVHHCQNERGDLAPEKMKTLTKNYAQENDHMRNMEKEAYLLGNMCFRDWEDSLDDKLQYKMKIAEQKFLKESKNMSVKISKKDLKSLISNLLEKKINNLEENHCGGGDSKPSKGQRKDDATSPKKPKKTPPKKPGEDCCGIKNCGHIVEEEVHTTTPEYDDDSNLTGDQTELPDGLQKAIIAKAKKGEGEGDKEKDKEGKKKVDEQFDNDGDGEVDDPRQPKGEGPELYEEISKIKTPEQENRLYESRFTKRNTKLFEKLIKEWTK